MPTTPPAAPGPAASRVRPQETIPSTSPETARPATSGRQPRRLPPDVRVVRLRLVRDAVAAHRQDGGERPGDLLSRRCVTEDESGGTHAILAAVVGAIEPVSAGGGVVRVVGAELVGIEPETLAVMPAV